LHSHHNVIPALLMHGISMQCDQRQCGDWLRQQLHGLRTVAALPVQGGH
jgi:hypothetical protein